MDRDLEAAEALVLLSENAVHSHSSPPPTVVPALQLHEEIHREFMIYHDGKNLIMKMVPRCHKRRSTKNTNKVYRTTKEYRFVESSFTHKIEEKGNINEKEATVCDVSNSDPEDFDIDVVGLDASDEAVIPQNMMPSWDYSPPVKKAKTTLTSKKPKDAFAKRKKTNSNYNDLH